MGTPTECFGSENRGSQGIIWALSEIEAAAVASSLLCSVCKFCDSDRSDQSLCCKTVERTTEFSISIFQLARSLLSGHNPISLLKPILERKDG